VRTAGQHPGGEVVFATLAGDPLKEGGGDVAGCLKFKNPNFPAATHETQEDRDR
jgi:hypothetical protein